MTKQFKCLLMLALVFVPQIVVSQIVTTIANVRASGDIDVDKNGDVYITDFGNPSLQNGTTVVKINPAGESSIFAANLARAPSGIVIGKNGTVFVATYNGGIIYSIDSNGDAKAIASANGPVGLALDSNQNLYVTECNINRISLVSKGKVTALASNQGLSCPNGLVLGHDSALYSVNFDNGGMHRIGLDGQVSLFATIPGGGNGHIEYHSGNYYVTGRTSNKIYQVDSDANVTVLAGTGADGNLDGQADVATFSRPNGLGISTDGNNLFVTGSSNFSSPTLAIRKIELQVQQNSESIAINSGLSGTWFKPETPGQGVFFDIIDGSRLFFGAWFTYAFEENRSIGQAEHRWYTIQGEFQEKTASLNIINTTGGRFDRGDSVESETVGSIKVSFDTCTSGKMEYSFDQSQGGKSGSIDIVRLTEDAFCADFIPDMPDNLVKITYIGNDGVYISDGVEGLLIDAIGDFGNFFINVPPPVQTAINLHEPPYDKTIAVLISHGHSDHYNITPVKNFINTSESIQLFIDSQSRGNFSSLGNRVESITIDRFESDTRTIGNTEITSISTRHFDQFGNDFSGVDNYAYLINMSGKRILHLGDIDYAQDNFQAIVAAINGTVDAVVLPAFNTLLNQQNSDLIAQFFPNAQIIALHLRAQNQSDVNGVNIFYPDAHIFNQPLESIEL